MIVQLIRSYRKIEKPIFYMIVAEFFVQLINSSFMAIQPLYMKQQGFSDGETAGYISYRFLGVLLLALPLGFFIKDKKLKPLLYVSAIAAPIFALCIIIAIKYHIHWLINTAQFLWGSSYLFIQVIALPFILRNAHKSIQTESISLSYTTWSFAGIFGGILIGSLNGLNPIFFNEERMLILISIISFSAIYFVKKININEFVPLKEKTNSSFFSYDWPIISKALTPTLIIAVGAGLTIPFISLFFSNVHHMNTGTFATMNAITSVFVAFASMLVPKIKKEIGYKIAVPMSQSFAVIALVLLATTQYYSTVSIAMYIAVFCFMLRQPLMNMAGPMTSEIVMDYVGKRNREMVSALTSAIWSGSWFISSIAFKILRNAGYPYVTIFLITAALFAVGVIWYYFLILDYHKKEETNRVESRKE